METNLLSEFSLVLPNRVDSAFVSVLDRFLLPWRIKPDNCEKPLIVEIRLKFYKEYCKC